jgi:hypothetical protein
MAVEVLQLLRHYEEQQQQLRYHQVGLIRFHDLYLYLDQVKLQVL